MRHGKYGPYRVPPMEDRFWKKVDKNGPNGCWIWTGLRYETGYGHFDMRHLGKWRARRAHIVAFEIVIGRVPDGKELDHLCRNRLCVNPEHLEPVTRRENLLRGDTIPARKAKQTHCIHGHAFDEQNTKVLQDGTRRCRRCIKENNDRYYAEHNQWRRSSKN